MTVVRCQCPISGAAISMRLWSVAEDAALRESERAQEARTRFHQFGIDEFISALRTARAARPARNF